MKKAVEYKLYTFTFCNRSQFVNVHKNNLFTYLFIYLFTNLFIGYEQLILKPAGIEPST